MNVCLDVVNLKDALIFSNAMINVLGIAIAHKLQVVAPRAIAHMRLVVKEIKIMGIIVTKTKNVVVISALMLSVKQGICYSASGLSL